MEKKKLHPYFLIALATSFGTMTGKNVFAQSYGKSLSMVFDPKTKKYFMGGESKLLIKEGEKSSLIDRIEISIDGGEFQNYDGSVKFDKEGKHTLKFRAVNPVNNWSPVQFVEAFVDLTAPTTELKFEHDKSHQKDGGNIFVAHGSTVSIISNDNLSGVNNIEYSFDGNTFVTYTKPITLDKQGSVPFYYRSSDKVGNQEQLHQTTILTDRNAPMTSLKIEDSNGNKPSSLNGRAYFSDSVAFKFEGTDDLSGVQDIWVTIDGKANVYSKPIFFLEEGLHKISYYGIDNVGNKEAPRSLEVYTVSTPPTTLAKAIGKSVNVGGFNYAIPGFKLELKARENIAGVEHIDVKVDSDEEFHPYLEPIVFLAPGVHHVTYRAVDRAGNKEPTRTYNIFIQDSGPETTIATAQPLVTRDGTVYSPAPNVLHFNVNNSPVGVDRTLVSLNDGPFDLYTKSITLTTTSKVYKVSYKSIDKLGNEEPVKTVTYNMIGALPVVDLFITNGRSSEEQVRTNYLEQPAQPVMAEEKPTSQANRKIAGQELKRKKMGKSRK